MKANIILFIILLLLAVLMASCTPSYYGTIKQRKFKQTKGHVNHCLTR